MTSKKSLGFEGVILSQAIPRNRDENYFYFLCRDSLQSGWICSMTFCLIYDVDTTTWRTYVLCGEVRYLLSCYDQEPNLLAFYCSSNTKTPATSVALEVDHLPTPGPSNIFRPQIQKQISTIVGSLGYERHIPRDDLELLKRT